MKDKIKRICKEKGITQKELAAQIGMSEVGLSKAINNGTRKETIQAIANALGVDVDEISKTELYAKYGSDKTVLEIGELRIPCYVLNDGRRVFSGRGIQKVIGDESKSGQWYKSLCNTEGLSRYLRAGDVSITDRLFNPIQFARNDAGGSQSITNGYEVTLLIDLCSAIIDASRAGVFNNSLMEFNCDAIIRAVAKVGIIALVDEVTGYNKEKNRAKDELQKFLRNFLREEEAKWVKVFPDVFFEDIYRMRHWSWTNTTKRPGVVGVMINDIIYERLGPLVLEELRRLNPKNESGSRRVKHHQFLTDDMGIPALKNHFDVIHALVVSSDYDWYRFNIALNKVYPKCNQQMLLEFEE